MRKTEFDSRLLIYRGRKFTLGLLMIIMGAVFMVVIHNGNSQKFHWLLMVPPITILGSLFIFFPLTEKWEYKPWQTKPRRVEQHFER